jgi:hypothetical protein
MTEDKKTTTTTDNFNPNEETTGALAIERAMKAMALKDDSTAEGEKLRNALLDEGDLLVKDDK